MLCGECYVPHLKRELPPLAFVGDDNTPPVADDSDDDDDPRDLFTPADYFSGRRLAQ